MDLIYMGTNFEYHSTVLLSGWRVTTQTSLISPQVWAKGPQSLHLHSVSSLQKEMSSKYLHGNLTLSKVEKMLDCNSKVFQSLSNWIVIDSSSSVGSDQLFCTKNIKEQILVGKKLNPTEQIRDIRMHNSTNASVRGPPLS